MDVSCSAVLSSLAVGAVGCLCYLIVSFYYKVSRYPKGPTPLPLIGNLLTFRTPRHLHEVFSELSYKYAPVYTIYLGPKPIVVISDPKIGTEALRKAAFAGRPDFGISDFMFGGDSSDVFFADYSRQWEVLKKMAHLAIKKYTSSARHPRVVAHVVDQLFDRKDENGRRLDIDVTNDFTLLMNAILASAAFGKEYAFDDEEFVNWKTSIERQRVGSGQLILIFFVPVFKYIFRDQWQRFQESHRFQEKFVEQRFRECNESFDGTNVTNFCQAVIAAKKEAEEEDRETSVYMTTKNMRNVVFDLFFAGTDTTKHTMCWIFLFLCKHRDMQIRMREEILSVVGKAENIPLPEHRDECHFTMAFIAECMRFRTIIPNSVPHKTTMDTEVAGHKLSKGTIVLNPIYKTFMDRELWTRPEEFNPDRFIVDGKFTTKPFPYFTAFGVGRRSCPGNNLALVTMFMTMARFMQRLEDLPDSPVFGIKGGNDSMGTGGQKVAAQWKSGDYVMEITA